MQTVTDILCSSVASHGQTVAFQAYGPDGIESPLTRGDVAAQAAALADVLHARGIGPGRRVALLADNCPQWPVAYFGVLLTGATLVPLDVKLIPGEIANILSRSSAAAVLACPGRSDKARAAAEGLCDVLPIPGTPEAPAPDEGALGRVLKRHTPRRDDLAVISFTSGTTGRPKGVMLTHANIASNVAAGPKVMDFRPGDNFLSVLPLNHLFEQTLGMVLPFHGGAKVTYLQSLNPRILLEAMHRTETTVAVIVPAVARLFHKRALAAIDRLPPLKRALTRGLVRVAAAAGRCGIPVGPVLLRRLRKAFGARMRVLFSGGAALDDEVAWFFKHIGLPIMQGYGLSETSPLISVNSPRHHRIGSVGRPIDKVAVRIDPLGGCDDGTGEILVRGPNVMAGYFEDDQATAAVLADGWLRTGDIGRLDRDGYLYITGRCKDVIISESGKNVYPNEIEAEIARRPEVGEVCVVALETSKTGRRREEIVAVVTAAPDATGDSDPASRREGVRQAIRAACGRLADYKHPGYVVLWEGDLPRTATLKVRKRDLVERITRDMLVAL